MAVLHWKQG